ncbi:MULTISPECIES: UDP-N-acetylmuramoyl-tripeptide--D-alanyl-D-alanine ligase [Paenibacillus]|uniref:UDP-N-acetylmuramoyl-tripeptide--D-alanyl-D- alanine ligase n=1 Tax=Paenibacillus TaxID=44249 RepID=UPI0001AFDBC1|nr:UDP-N-acetylmuramoyl-tripeptide--D-alanyl-D-alanine ligase [Paenibacillus sp. oral taxon 786]EES72486.1 UDP-N-acetylmuramoyl-tripeptide--D-alanyl-D-alanine ligase [Paenibacillus sp. oral taxon 786 str. D14]MCT2195335.1 UDP-N-acetylmuramoyl-tripeptide--D-alanyl-D-alanine ligase [Paenibacillus sp. p3-SID1389]
MIKRNLAEIAAMCGGQIREAGDAGIVVQGVVTDSRQITKGCLFVPLAGERFDGHDFASDCLQAGAGACLWALSKGTPPGPAVLVDDTLIALQALAKSYLTETGAKVVGITGSNGKTTTKDLVYALLSTTYKVHKTKGNFNNHIGLPLTILAMPEDTEIAVLEMGMSGRGEIELLSKIGEPETAVVTNIGESHLLQLGSREEIARAKLEILAGMKPGGLFIYNGDEPLIPKVLAEPSTVKPEGLQTATFGLRPENDQYPTGILFTDHQTLFTPHGSEGDPLELPLLGEHNVSNALAAITVARHYGVGEAAIREGFSKVELTGMRIEVITGRSGITILNDAYNASPTSMKAALGVLEHMKGYRKKIAVLGDMLELGDSEADYHREIGEMLTPGTVDQLFTCGPLSRHIAEGAKKQLDPNFIHAYTDKSELIRKLVSLLHPQDVVLVKASRGMKLEEVVEAIKTSELTH